MVKSNVVITEYRNRICSMVFCENQLEDLHVDTAESLLGGIYVAKVKNINKNINAAFVELFDGQMAFLPIDDIGSSVLIRSGDGRIRKTESHLNVNVKLCEGDEIPVQVIKEGVKTKDPVVTTKLSLTGAYCVVTLDKRKGGVQYSKKLSSDKKQKMKSLLQKSSIEKQLTDTGCAAVVRTGAGSLTDYSVLQTELLNLLKRMEELLTHAKTRTCFSCIHKSTPSYIEHLHHFSDSAYEEIVTDSPVIYETLLNDYKGGKSVRLYNDSFPLQKLYSIETKMDELFAKKVHLKSGANLIIEYTEAMTVVDVNTAKCIAKKDKDTFNYQINIEAAQMIARQLRLRNISGIIIVDFINMENEQYKKNLVQELKRLLKSDPVPCSFVDITTLGLVEITRKKVKKPIYEVFY